MKKHLFIFSFMISAFAAATVDAQARPRTFAAPQANVRQSDRSFENNDYYGNEGHSCDCNKCRKGNKGKGHHGNNGKGKGHNKHSSCCNHDCHDGNGYNGNDHQRNGWNERDNGDYGNSDRNTRGGGNGGYGGNTGGQQNQDKWGKTRAGQHTSSARIKTRPTTRSTQSSTRPGGSKRAIPVPIRSRN